MLPTFLKPYKSASHLYAFRLHAVARGARILMITHLFIHIVRKEKNGWILSKTHFHTPSCSIAIKNSVILPHHSVDVGFHPKSTETLLSLGEENNAFVWVTI